MKIGDREITAPICAIIRLYDGISHPGLNYQVIIDPAKLSKSQRFIRFDHGNMSEVNGWREVAAIQIMEVLEEVKPA